MNNIIFHCYNRLEDKNNHRYLTFLEVQNNYKIKKSYLTLSVGNPVISISIKTPSNKQLIIKIGQNETVAELIKQFKQVEL